MNFPTVPARPARRLVIEAAYRSAHLG